MESEPWGARKEGSRFANDCPKLPLDRLKDHPAENIKKYYAILSRNALNLYRSNKATELCKTTT